MSRCHYIVHGHGKYLGRIATELRCRGRYILVQSGNINMTVRRSSGPRIRTPRLSQSGDRLCSVGVGRNHDSVESKSFLACHRRGKPTYQTDRLAALAVSDAARYISCISSSGSLEPFRCLSRPVTELINIRSYYGIYVATQLSNLQIKLYVLLWDAHGISSSFSQLIGRARSRSPI